MHRIVLAVAAVAALLLTSASAAAAAVPSVSTACSNVLSNQKAPTVGRTGTYTVTDSLGRSVGSVTIKRTSLRGLRVVGTAPATGYTSEVITRSGRLVKVVFRQAGSNHRVFWAAHIGRTNTKRLQINTTTCG